MSEMRAQLELLLGDCCPVPSLGASGTPEVNVEFVVLEKLNRYWSKLPPASKPRLRGMAMSGASGPRKLHLVLSANSKGTSILVSADFPSGRRLPNFRETWAYAAWWENELACFDRVETENRETKGGVTWRQN